MYWSEAEDLFFLPSINQMIFKKRQNTQIKNKSKHLQVLMGDLN